MFVSNTIGVPSLLLLLLVLCSITSLSSLVQAHGIKANSDGDSVVGSCFDDTSLEHFPKHIWKYCQPIPNTANTLFMYYTPHKEDGNVLLGFHATANTYGWTALAFGGNGGMKGASQIVVRKTDNEDNDDEDSWIAEDRYSSDYEKPKLDTSQDVELLFADQTDDGQTSWGVMLMMNSCDHMDDGNSEEEEEEEGFDYPIDDRSGWMHWAFGDEHEFEFHNHNKGQFHANLLQPPKDAPTLEGYDVATLTMPNVDVVLGENGTDPTNPYICTFFDLAQVIPDGYNVEDKIHVVHMSPIIDEVSKNFVHHMLLYSCPYVDGETVSHLAVIDECESMPSGCDQVKFAWAVGGQDIVLPEEVGVPIAEGNRWVAMQMHYYNPDLIENVTDSSGVRAYLTSEPRPIDAGFMELNGGTFSDMRSPLPGGESSISLDPLVIPGDICTSEWEEPLTVLGAIHHMHLVGKTMRIDIERGGKFLGTVRPEYRYDFNHQSFEAPSSITRTLMPNDQINVYCEYDTSSRTEETDFGDLSQQEMCYGLILYYPRQPQMESFGYFRLPEEIVQFCTQPGTANTTYEQTSLCAEIYSTNMPLYFGVDNDEEPAFAALDYCNGQAGSEWFRGFITFICPECHLNQTCTEEDIIDRGQNIHCAINCDEIGVTVYPDTSVTESPRQGMWCGSSDGDDDDGAESDSSPVGFEGYIEFAAIDDSFRFETCQVFGDLSKASLVGVTSEPTSAPAETTSSTDSAGNIPRFIEGIMVVVLLSVTVVLGDI